MVTVLIIAANAAVFFLWQPSPDTADGQRFAYETAAIACEVTTGAPLSIDEITTGRCLDGAQTPAFPDKNVWLALVVSMFLHGSVFHLLSNMWFLWVFGNNVEEAFGRIGYALLYLVTGLVATGAFVLANPEATVPLVGASGAIAGVLGAYLVLYPTHRVLSWFVFLFVPVPAIVFLGFWFLAQFGVQADGVAWEAHVGGFVAGVLITLPLRPMLLTRIDRIHRPVRSAFLPR